MRPVSPGAKVKLTVENPDDLQHNLVILKSDSKDKNGQQFAADVADHCSWNNNPNA